MFYQPILILNTIRDRFKNKREKGNSILNETGKHQLYHWGKGFGGHLHAGKLTQRQ
jgi:hypothetical protein